MRKLITVLVTLMLVLVPLMVSTAVAEECSIFWKVNSKLISVCGKKYRMDVAPTEESDSVYIPLRFITEWLGYDVEWIDSERAVSLETNVRTVKLWINNTDLLVDGDKKTLAESPIISDNRTLVSTDSLFMMIGKQAEVDGRNISMTLDEEELCYVWHDFEFPKDGNPGETVKFSDYMNDPDNKAVIVQIWYTNCKPCHKELEFLGNLYEEYKDVGLEVVGVCTDGPGLETERAELLELLGANFTIALDENFATQATWYDPVFPSFFLLTPGEKCVTWFHERYSEEANAELDKMVKGICGVID